MTKTLFAGLGIAFAVFATSAQAITYVGSTSLTGPTYNRPLSGLTGLSGVGTAVHYDAFSFTATTTGSYNFLSLATGAWDNFLVLYSPTFNPAAGLSNALAANDDGPPPAGIGSAGFTANLTAGSTYVLVTTGFGNSDVGAFTNSYNLTSAVPEPGQLAMLALGLIGVTATRRIQQRNLSV
jgi:PEP-CTERM motif